MTVLLKKAGSNIFKSSEKKAEEAAEEAAARRAQMLVALRGVIDGLALPIENLELEVDINKYLIEWQLKKEFDDPITLHHLLTH